jgi:hypothetical protein
MNMDEIEKAVKDLESAAVNEALSWDEGVTQEEWLEAGGLLRDARTKLMQLIERLAQYQTREVSNDRT